MPPAKAVAKVKRFYAPRTTVGISRDLLHRAKAGEEAVGSRKRAECRTKAGEGSNRFYIGRRPDCDRRGENQGKDPDPEAEREQTRTATKNPDVFAGAK